MIATGPVQQVLQNVGAKIIAKAALKQYRAVAFDQPSGQTMDVAEGELLVGGYNNITTTVDSVSHLDTVRANMIRVTIDD
jgi:hypothetical protein